MIACQNPEPTKPSFPPLILTSIGHRDRPYPHDHPVSVQMGSHYKEAQDGNYFYFQKYIMEG